MEYPGTVMRHWRYDQFMAVGRSWRRGVGYSAAWSTRKVLTNEINLRDGVLTWLEWDGWDSGRWRDVASRGPNQEEAMDIVLSTGLVVW